MGAQDDMFAGRSTFMVELQEAGSVLAQSSPRSLVILDELGRGTSTHDGVAIAYASLHYLIHQVGCLTLFVTHYPPVTELQQSCPQHVANYHMSFYVQTEQADGGPAQDACTDDASVAFLYQLEAGCAGSSYGLNVARLAGLSRDIIERARVKAANMQLAECHRRSQRLALNELVRSKPKSLEHVRQIVERLRTDLK